MKNLVLPSLGIVKYGIKICGRKIVVKCKKSIYNFLPSKFEKRIDFYLLNQSRKRYDNFKQTFEKKLYPPHIQ